MAYLLAAIIFCVVMGLPSIVMLVAGTGGATLFDIFPRLLRYFREGEPLIPEGLRVTERSVQPDRVLKIIATGQGTDEDRSVPVRMTYLVGDTSLLVRKEIIQPTGTLFRRTEHRLMRPSPGAD